MEITISLVPPSFASSTEIIFGPRREDNLAIFRNITMGKGKRKRGRSTDDGAIGRVLRSVAWAHELVLGGRPWYNTTQVSAHCEWEKRERERGRVAGTSQQGVWCVSEENAQGDHFNVPALRPYFSRVLSSLTIRYVASPFNPCASDRSLAAFSER